MAPESDAMPAKVRRYRLAAENVLQQLDWCIGYLHGIRKSAIAARLAKNRSYIKRNLMQEPTQPLPSGEVPFRPVPHD
jgi:hypothetical protein